MDGIAFLDIPQEYYKQFDEIINTKYTGESHMFGIIERINLLFSLSKCEYIRDLKMVFEHTKTGPILKLYHKNSPKKSFDLIEESLAQANMVEECVFKNILTGLHYSKTIWNRDYKYHKDTSLVLVVGPSNEETEKTAGTIAALLNKSKEPTLREMLKPENIDIDETR